MADGGAATAAVESTLAREQAELEETLALWRIRVFGFFTIASVVICALAYFTLPPEYFRYNLLPIGYFGLATVYAFWLRSRLRRFGVSPKRLVATVVFDTIAMIGIMFVFWALKLAGFFPRADGVNSDEMLILWTAFSAAPALVLIGAINSLRVSLRLDLIAMGTGIVMFLLVAAPIHANPQKISVVVTLVMCGLVFATGTRRTRRMLERSAKEQLLRRYLSPAAVERVLTDPDAGLAPGGQLAIVTLVSTDLRGFTAMSEKLSPRQTIEELNAYHETMLAEIERHGGMLDKFIGDGALVVFGLPLPGVALAADQGAGAAARCALAMLGALERHNVERQARQSPPLAMGIGVHTGPVISGNLGAGARLEFTVIGDAVNTASRIEGLTKELGSPLLVSGNTVALLDRASFPGLQEVGPTAIRGKSEKLSVFALTAAA